jgi:hypothetical protein
MDDNFASDDSTDCLDEGRGTLEFAPSSAIGSSQYNRHTSPAVDSDDVPGLRPFKKRRRGGNNGKSAHAAWAYSRTRLPSENERNKHNQKLFYCSRCSWVQPVQNAERHLRVAHKISILPKISVQASPLANAFERQCEKEQQNRESKSNDILFNVLGKARFRDALARLIIRGNLSHRFVELEEWKAVCLALNPQCEKVLLRSRRSIPRRIGVIFERQRLAVKRSLQNALSRVHLSTDSWTSGVSHQGEFQAINASFVDESGCLQQVLLALPELHHGHAGELVAPLICRTLEVYGIEKRLGYVTADNASSNDTLCRAIERYMFAKHAIKWSAQQHRLRCLGHILNIAVQAFLFCANSEALDIAS